MFAEHPAVFVTQTKTACVLKDQGKVGVAQVL